MGEEEGFAATPLLEDKAPPNLGQGLPHGGAKAPLLAWGNMGAFTISSVLGKEEGCEATPLLEDKAPHLGARSPPGGKPPWRTRPLLKTKQREVVSSFKAVQVEELGKLTSSLDTAFYILTTNAICS